jgi:hypothetical protein
MSHHLPIAVRCVAELSSFCADLVQRNYGYFSSPQLSIFTTATDKGYDFSSFRSAGKFSDAVADRYQEYLQKEEEIWEQDGDVDRKGTKEVWHTPGELFKVRSRLFLSTRTGS